MTSKKLKSYYATRKPLLKPTDRIKRRKWAKERLSWTDQDWAKVIFLDESNFEVFNRKVFVLLINVCFFIFFIVNLIGSIFKNKKK